MFRSQILQAAKVLRGLIAGAAVGGGLYVAASQHTWSLANESATALDRLSHVLQPFCLCAAWMHARRRTAVRPAAAVPEPRAPVAESPTVRGALGRSHVTHRRLPPAPPPWCSGTRPCTRQPPSSPLSAPGPGCATAGAGTTPMLRRSSCRSCAADSARAARPVRRSRSARAVLGVQLATTQTTNEVGQPCTKYTPLAACWCALKRLRAF